MEPNKTTPTPKPSPEFNPDDLSYQVMPKNVGSPQDFEAPKSAPAPITPVADSSNLQLAEPAKSRKTVYIIAAIIVLLGVGALAFYMLGTGTAEQKPVEEESRLPKAKLIQYFGQETCADKQICGDEADPDSDGLSNYKEFIAGTHLMKNDSDEDGLADGDEVNIFKTDPTNKFTDPTEDARVNNFTDGVKIKNNYDPLTPGFKMTETRKQQIADDTKKHGLHEPTLTTLKPAEASQQPPTGTPTP